MPSPCKSVSLHQMCTCHGSHLSLCFPNGYFQKPSPWKWKKTNAFKETIEKKNYKLWNRKHCGRHSGLAHSRDGDWLSTGRGCASKKSQATAQLLLYSCQEEEKSASQVPRRKSRIWRSPPPICYEVCVSVFSHQQPLQQHYHVIDIQIVTLY